LTSTDYTFAHLTCIL